MNNIYELYGRLAETYEEQRAAHLNTIDVLRRVAIGEIYPAQLVVSENTWQVVPLAQPVESEAEATDEHREPACF